MSADLIFPTKILDQHLVVLGKTGAGKSSALRHIVEHLLRQNKRVAVIDPKGDWWGLKWSADGKSEGFPVIAFGDFKGRRKGDIPISDRAGGQVADLVASGNRPCIIGFSGWTITAMTEFWIHFSEGIFSQNQGELFIVGDEFHNFAPKGSLKGKEGRGTMSLHWSNRLLSEGRGIGIVCLLASQRPAKVHNDTLTSCETLIAMRVTHAADRRAYEDWIDGCGDETHGREVIASVASMSRGEAFVWSPEINFGPKRLKFPMFETFDSFAPPQLQKKVISSDWANVDLEAVKAKLASVIEEHKRNDPDELNRTISELRRELTQAKKAAPAVAAPKAEVREVPVLSKVERGQVERVSKALDNICEQQSKALGVIDDTRKLIALMTARATSNVVPPRPSPVRTVPVLMKANEIHTRRPAPMTNGETSLPKAERKILQVLANFPEGKTRREIGVIAGYKHSGGGFNNALGALRSAGLVSGSDPVKITQAGLDAYGPVDPLPTGRELFDYWMGHQELGRAEREILRVLYESRRAMPKEEIAPLTVSDRGTPYEANGGGFNNAVGRLRTYELIDGGRGQLQAIKEFFE